MTSRRTFLATASAAIGLGGSALAQSLDTPSYNSPHMSLDEMKPHRVRVRDDIEAGSIHIFPQYFHLYLVTAPGEAIEYHIAVGEEGRNLRGETVVKRKVEWPSWTPTANMIAREPEKYGPLAGGMEGGPDNPLGARAMYLYRGGRDTHYRIHGTPQPFTIGRAVSSGCIRLLNDDVIDLYERVEIGTRVRFYTP